MTSASLERMDLFSRPCPQLRSWKPEQPRTHAETCFAADAADTCVVLYHSLPPSMCCNPSLKLAREWKHVFRSSASRCPLSSFPCEGACTFLATRKCVCGPWYR
uniref:Uncharacterized protein n=1 Tax=Triticum urartu TaxID=4572 RepID=A0A8R7UVJ5_TRIUA